ncbi:MAG: type I-C CRISPR-associated protein Cas8c/Csd1 [Lachnospiraceae bacterium]|nr:type I-C CRISPR-associated protein Cas8c/Csd1 [Lachnospiraceae bacterium]
MSWMTMLCEVYDNCKSEIGRRSANGSMLFPIAHSTAEAQVEIFIDANGNFVRANRVEKEDATTLIPVTEDSASRSSGISPMPLCDKLCYIAGDYDEYIQPEKSMRPYYDAYMERLRVWATEDNTPDDVKVVYKYLQKGTVIEDLKRVEAYEKENDFARFIVIPDELDKETKGVWQKEEMIESYIAFYLSGLEGTGIDYVTGEDVPLANKLPAKIRNTGDKAKIISSNDESGFTFRGRFLDARQATGIGYLTGQKAHNALRWLIAKQGYRNDSECIVCFSNGQAVPPDPCRFSLFEETEQTPDTSEDYARQVRLAIAGYRVKLQETQATKIAVMSVDTADGSLQGRLAINYYTEMPGDEFLDNLEKWQQECIWEHTYQKNQDGKYVKFIGAPLPRDIVLAAYGTEQGAMLDMDGKVRKKYVDRILPCITQRKRLPRDIMLSAVRNAGEPQRFSRYNAHKILTIACALVHKYQIDEGKEVYDMALKKESMDRSYLFGRLLAIADKLEEQVYFKEGVQGRETNARKFWSTYVRKPAKTWAVIYDKLLPYINRLSGGSRNFYSLILEEVMGKLADTDAFHNEQLNENYLLGYYSQYEALRKKEENDNE